MMQLLSDEFLPLLGKSCREGRVFWAMFFGSFPKMGFVYKRFENKRRRCKISSLEMFENGLNNVYFCSLKGKILKRMVAVWGNSIQDFHCLG